MSVQRDRPYPNSNFLVDLGDGDPNTVQAGLIEVVLPDARVQVVEYRSGNDKSNDPHKLTTQTGYGNLILKRATHGSLTWYAWWNEVRNGDQAAFRTVVGPAAQRRSHPDRAHVEVSAGATGQPPIRAARRARQRGA